MNTKENVDMVASLDPTLVSLTRALIGRKEEIDKKYGKAARIPYNTTCAACGRSAPPGLDIHEGTCPEMLASLRGR